MLELDQFAPARHELKRITLQILLIKEYLPFVTLILIKSSDSNYLRLALGKASVPPKFKSGVPGAQNQVPIPE